MSYASYVMDLEGPTEGFVPQTAHVFQLATSRIATASNRWTTTVSRSRSRSVAPARRTSVRPRHGRAAILFPSARTRRTVGSMTRRTASIALPLHRPTVCVSCGVPTLNGSRCVPCNRGFRRAVRNPAYDRPEWRKHSARRRAEHVARQGWVCPGYRRPAHPADRLTLDHPVPLALGGALLQDGDVLCPGCNTRKRWVQTPTRRASRRRADR